MWLSVNHLGNVLLLTLSQHYGFTRPLVQTTSLRYCQWADALDGDAEGLNVEPRRGAIARAALNFVRVVRDGAIRESNGIGFIDGCGGRCPSLGPSA